MQHWDFQDQQYWIFLSRIDNTSIGYKYQILGDFQTMLRIQ